ncbi:zinc uptake protein ZrgA [Vibrio metschnikovii]|uniref:zinc uptake protein ZrgA n=1 Tax=Vibrio metschnikovii TaxID=28172 RepID=UPI002FCC74EC
MLTKPLLALSISAVLSTAAFAHQEFRQHDAHVHGQIELNIAQDGTDLLIEITAPGADVVGFEHAPHNETQVQALNRALDILGQAESLFTLNSAAKCQLEETHVSHTLSGDKDNHDHSDHAHHDHGHDHKHDHHKHHDHKHQHGEFTAQYHYQCENVGALTQINTEWFALFPSTEKMLVNLLTERTQTAVELTKQQTRLSL